MSSHKRRFMMLLLCVLTATAMVLAGCSNMAGSVNSIGEGETQESSMGTESTAGVFDEGTEQTEAEDQTGQTDQAAEEEQPAEEPQLDEETAKSIDEEISVSDIGSIAIGQTENAEAGTGCTVIACREGMAAGLDVRGGGTSSRESELLDPISGVDSIHAIVLAGGGSYGLDASGGVLKYLEEKGVGNDTGDAKIPMVVQTDIYDLAVGDSSVRPDADMGYQAAKMALESPNYKNGNYGAGCGATVGKIAGLERSMKGGIGSYAIKIGDLEIGAIVAVNSLGDIYDWKSGEKIAGLMTEDRTDFHDTTQYMAETKNAGSKTIGNSAVGVVITNADLGRAQLCNIAGMTQTGFARSIRPVNMSSDGDSIYAVSVGTVQADEDLVGSLSAMVMSEAVKRAVYTADTAYGAVSAKELNKN